MNGMHFVLMRAHWVSILPCLLHASINGWDGTENGTMLNTKQLDSSRYSACLLHFLAEISQKMEICQVLSR